MIGCGYGNLDLELVGGCFPNITELTAVEPDADQMAELKTRVAQLFPTVTTNFYQETAQSWKGSDKPFDAVLLIHSLYYVPVLQRPTLIKKLFDSIPSDGLVFVITNPGNLENPNGLIRMISLLGIPSLNWRKDVDGPQVYDLITSAGFRECYQLPIEGQMEVRALDDDFLDLFVFWSRGTVSREKVREAAIELFGSEKIVPYDIWLGVFRKP